MKLLQKTLVAAAVAVSAPAFADIAPPSTGNGELFLVMFNPTAEVSLVVDLGIGINDFRAGWDFNADNTIDSRTWTIDGNNAEVGKFVAKAGATSDWRWYVQAGDQVGSQTTFGGRGLLTTLTDGQSATTIGETKNNSFNSMLPTIGGFLEVANQNGDADMATGGDYAKNGVGFGDQANGAYALKAGFAGVNGATFASFTNDNAFGTSSAVHYVSRASSNPNLFVQTNQFDNAYGPSSFAVSAAPGGNYTLTFTTAVPEPGTYALLLAGLAMVGALVRRRQA